MIPQALRSVLGLLTSICRRGRPQKALLSAPRAQVSCRGVSVVDTLAPCVLRQRAVTRLPPSAARRVQDVSPGQKVWRAPGESSEGMAQLEEDPALTERQEAPRRDPKRWGRTAGT